MHQRTGRKVIHFSVCDRFVINEGRILERLRRSDACAPCRSRPPTMWRGPPQSIPLNCSVTRSVGGHIGVAAKCGVAWGPTPWQGGLTVPGNRGHRTGALCEGDSMAAAWGRLKGYQPTLPSTISPDEIGVAVVSGVLRRHRGLSRLDFTKPRRGPRVKCVAPRPGRPRQPGLRSARSRAQNFDPPRTPLRGCGAQARGAPK